MSGRGPPNAKEGGLISVSTSMGTLGQQGVERDCFLGDGGFVVDGFLLEEGNSVVGGYGQPRSPLPTDPIPLAPFDALLPAIVVEKTYQNEDPRIVGNNIVETVLLSQSMKSMEEGNSVDVGYSRSTKFLCHLELSEK
ncbi:hypothetical protein DAPPUDRAFT_239008 [Daphnia pulex]|uniref:Uncharacterized protein n=1 Tax=Daphnia pulex TaxID=6669 RepID=E9G7Z6_DAPPU|nr:hypothetical protein DAPPUDRAFT_239008 [Daphnia pulex]|eukprot:EFX84568.1 hypothetical protein DAPPUDRAFT_239008 [Daphnia pulex]